MQKAQYKPLAQRKILWIGALVAVIVIASVATMIVKHSDPASSKNVRAAFIRQYASCLKGPYDLSRGASISINPTDADGRMRAVISQQVAVLATLNTSAKPSVLRFEYEMVNQDDLFNTNPAPQFAAADQETADFLHHNCASIN